MNRLSYSNIIWLSTEFQKELYLMFGKRTPIEFNTNSQVKELIMINNNNKWKFKITNNQFT